jgi:hypothetical protein
VRPSPSSPILPGRETLARKISDYWIDYDIYALVGWFPEDLAVLQFANLI